MNYQELAIENEKLNCEVFRLRSHCEAQRIIIHNLLNLVNESPIKVPANISLDALAIIYGNEQIERSAQTAQE